MRSVKKFILCLSGRLRIQSSNTWLQPSISSENHGFQKKKYELREDHYSQESQVKGFSVSIDEKPVLNGFSKCLDFYTSHGFGNGTYVADVNNVPSDSIKLYEAKLIDNSARSYDYSGYDSLFSERFVIEFLYERDGLHKSFYLPTASEAEEIILNSKETEKGCELYRSLITSITEEASYKAALPSIQTYATANKAGDVDTQSVLDHYLSVANQADKYLILGNYTSSDAKPIQTSDDSIINLIPKSHFRTNGVYNKGGAEWGYFVHTYTDYGNNKISSVLLYDVINYKTDFFRNEIVQIKPIFTWNFKYNYDTDIVSKESENNYCIAHPNYTAGVHYIKHHLDSNSFVPKNPDETGYSKENDNGFCIGSRSSKFVGTSKNFNGGIESLQSLSILLGNIAISLLTAGLSTAEQLAIGITSDLIFEAAKQLSNSYSSPIHNTDEKGKTVLKIDKVEEYSSFDYAKKGNFAKFVSFSSPTSNDGNPLLFKEESDSINYELQVYSSDLSDSYTGLLIHEFSASVFNDNTNLFHQTPTYIGGLSTEWSYLIGESFDPKTVTINKTVQNKERIFGDDNDAVALLKTGDEGIYDIVMTNRPADTSLTISQISANSGHTTTYIDALEKNRTIPKAAFIKHYVLLSANSTYEIRIKRFLGSTRYFGGALLSIYKSDSSTVTTGDSEYGRNYVYRNRMNNGYHINNCFRPSTDGQYTIVAAPSSSSSSKDTYITILDSNFKKIAEDDDGYGNYMAGIRINLLANHDYYIISRPYGLSTSCNYEVDIFKQNYLPEFRGKVNQLGLSIGLSKSIPIHSLLISQSEKRSIIFLAYWDTSVSDPNFPSIYMSIYNPRLSASVSIANILFSSFTFSFDANTLYLIEFSATTSIYANIHLHIKEA